MFSRGVWALLLSALLHASVRSSGSDGALRSRLSQTRERTVHRIQPQEFSWNTSVDPRCLNIPGLACSCSTVNASAGSCSGSCSGCFFSYNYSTTTGLTLRAETDRCLLLRSPGAFNPEGWYALSSSRPLVVARSSNLTMRAVKDSDNTRCPTAFGSYDDNGACQNCHVGADCALRCECKAGTPPGRYVPMGCDLWGCNDLALVHDSLTWFSIKALYVISRSSKYHCNIHFRDNNTKPGRKYDSKPR